MNDYVIGIDLASGPDCPVMSDGTAITNKNKGVLFIGLVKNQRIFQRHSLLEL